MSEFYLDLEMLELRLSCVTVINNFQLDQLSIARSALDEIHYLLSLRSFTFEEIDRLHSCLREFNDAMLFLER